MRQADSNEQSYKSASPPGARLDGAFVADGAVSAFDGAGTSEHLLARGG